MQPCRRRGAPALCDSKRYGGRDGSNLWMAVIREHFASKGLGLHNDLQNEHSIAGNFPIVTMLDRYGGGEQKTMIEGSMTGKYRVTFRLTEPHHGSDTTHMETRAVATTRDNVKGWLISGPWSSSRPKPRCCGY